MNDDGSKNHEEFGVFQIVILILSVVVLAALVADTAFKLPAEISSVLQKIDTLICVVFLADFGIRFYKAKSKLTFLKWGWIDLIASIPNLQIFRWGRLVRVLRIIRLIRALRATHKVTTLLLKNKFEGGVASVVLTAVLLVIFSSVGILICEQQDPQANIKTADDAVWWSVTTITTVGYGDYYDQKQALSRFSVSAVLLTKPVLSVIRRELRLISPDVKIGTDQIRSVLEQEVLKREVLEGDKADEARKRIAKALKNKAEKEPDDEETAGQTKISETAPPQSPTPPTSVQPPV